MVNLPSLNKRYQRGMGCLIPADRRSAGWRVLLSSGQQKAAGELSVPAPTGITLLGLLFSSEGRRDEGSGISEYVLELVGWLTSTQLFL